MSLMAWDDSRFGLAIDAVDAEHKHLVHLMNSLHDVSAAGGDRDGVLLALRKLGTATTKHFANEEAYMRSVAYPGLGTHARLHAKLLRQFGEHCAAFEAAGEDSLPKAFFSFLKFWLSAHICGADRKYSDHAHEQAA